MGCCKNFDISDYDQMGVPVGFKMNGKTNVGTKVGGVCSLVLSIVIAAYAIMVYSINFFTTNPVFETIFKPLSLDPY